LDQTIMMKERTRTILRRTMTFLFAGVSLLYLAARLMHPTSAHAHEGLVHEGCGTAAVVTAGDLSITGAFSRAMLPGAPAAGGYLTISNTGTADDTLVAAQSQAAGDVQLHEMKMEGDVMKMAELPSGIAVPAGGSVVLEPGGLHLMFLNVQTPFKEGECVEVMLSFEKAGEVPVMLPIGSIAADAPEHGKHGG
jgi:periplasmic copper chaperone A